MHLEVLYARVTERENAAVHSRTTQEPRVVRAIPGNLDIQRTDATIITPGDRRPTGGDIFQTYRRWARRFHYDAGAR